MRDLANHATNRMCKHNIQSPGIESECTSPDNVRVTRVRSPSSAVLQKNDERRIHQVSLDCLKHRLPAAISSYYVTSLTVFS